MKYRLVNFCEFDKYAEKSYCAIHGVSETLNLGDITKVNEQEIPYFNMICGGSPCQDFSLAGKQAGSVWKCKDCGYAYNPLQIHYTKRDTCEKCGSHNLDKTRSSLLVEWLRMIRGVRPDWGIYENVKNIVGKKFKDTTFKAFEEELHEYGYNTYWSVLNAKNYGIPQNRERVYLILIKKELDNGKFEFPKSLDISVSMMDILEEEVEEKFYLPQEKVQKLIQDMENRKALLFEPDEEQTKKIKNDLIFLGQIKEGGAWKNPQAGRVYSAEGCSPAINTCQGGNLQPKIVTIGKYGGGFCSSTVLSAIGISSTQMAGHNQTKIGELHTASIRGRHMKNGNVRQQIELGREKEICHALTTVQKDNVILVRQKTKKGYEECIKNGIANLSYPSVDKRGRVQEHGKICPTLTTQPSGICQLKSILRIRKLTPLECFRLMGFDDEDFQKAKEAGISNSQLYKQAGNSIVVDVLFHIFLNLYIAMPYLFEDIQLTSFFSGIGAFEKALERLMKQING
ncbi:DNA (cytosine-5-)-methyltransferase [[Ruminococcus] gnavus]|uniref:Cytosine-specific methyltransferase n=3 Tax=Mediterraneibacter gnavus TaxID=33038 RepID=A0AAW6DCE1_MEDGN|nr:DNA (cytosine-5-)-methyltransferase [Mediterraneibacter gnavus]MDU2005152.1 DNA (cytosine-5-)-methyltransferase [Lachnospiraceae bacterium]MDB8678587.1 DNA (cytosine-5-)-methyltransferase [Mediterraneibacter gnavus]MDB8686273.1 DNA (cytosine-5-)-methyltransferase [Mediterraneibacter gnavus]MDB8689696.1 DNA (cytosine-5-)-methyltransferase [Mediterraneibacter gnavus]MDU2031848.1 DNA (cytosine-5-)-methyltransferase [Lachnospiraceae bacterium]